jgi:hypothetical protein
LALQLALALGVICHQAIEDHEAVIDIGEAIILLAAVAFVLLGFLSLVAHSLGTPREVVFHHAALLEGVLDRDLMVWAWLLKHLVKNAQGTLG